MIELVPFEPGHARRIKPGEFDARVLSAANIAALEDWAGGAETAVDGATVLGFGGVALDGLVARPWMVLSDEMRHRHPIWLTRLARNVFAYLETRGARVRPASE